MDGTICSTLEKIFSEASALISSVTSAQAAPTSVDCPEFAFLGTPIEAGSWFLPQLIAYEGWWVFLVLLLAFLWFAS